MANTRYGRKEKRREKKGRRKPPPWSDLPTELVELIFENCSFNDQVRLRAVCRRWQSIPRVQPIKQLPWLMVYDDWEWSTCKLFDLTYKKTYTVNTSTMKKYFEEQNLQNAPYIKICASKSGWLLLSYILYQNPNPAFLLYNPFTKRIIKLPTLQNTYHRITAAFSAEPTSADCVFFALDNLNHADAVAASTYRIGDTAWTTHVFPGHFYAIDNVVYSQGLFWCVDNHGRLATFSVAQGMWNRLQSPAPVFLSYGVLDETNLVEANGNLLLIHFSYNYKLRCVFRLDRSQMSWVLVEDLGDQTLFLGPITLSMSTIPGKLGVSGKIHYRCGFRGRFLSSDLKRSYSYPKRYGPLAVEDHLSKIWIDPPY